MIYCFDIDGTLCSLTKNSRYAEAKPFKDVIRKINDLYEKGNYIKMATARGSVSKIDWTEVTQNQLKKWGVKYHELIMNQKPNADLYVDDKCIHINEWRKKEIKVGLVAGAFDLYHPGYALLFKDAKTVCSHLIVALHREPLMERKIKKEIIHSIDERILILETIKYVDEIVVYDTEKDLREILQEKKPDIRILGSDYQNKKITGEDLDIPIYYHQRNHDWSNTNLRLKIHKVDNL